MPLTAWGAKLLSASKSVAAPHARTTVKGNGYTFPSMAEVDSGLGSPVFVRHTRVD